MRLKRGPASGPVKLTPVRLRRDGIYYTLPSGHSRLWRWSLTLPLLLAFLCFGAGLFTHWLGRSLLHRNLILGELGPDGPRLARSLFFESVKTDISRSLFTPSAPQTSELEDVHLFMSQDDIDQMIESERLNWQDPNPSRERFRAFIRLGENPFLECKVSSRGVSEWHHQPEKPSLRVRFSKRKDSPGFRWLELQRIEDVLAMANWYPDTIGSQLGVMNGRSRHVRVFLNRKPLGVYSLNTRPGDNLAMENGALPGLFFKGDRLELETVWTTPEDWGIFGDIGETEKAWFGEFLKVVGEGKAVAETRLALSRYLDEDSYAKWIGIADFVGSSHADDHHNQMFYLSTYEGKLKPLIWDFNALGILMPSDAKFTLVSNHLKGLALQDPRFVHQRNLVLLKLATEDHWTEILTTEVKKIEPDLMADRSLVQLTNIVPYSMDWSSWVEEMKGRIYALERPGLSVPMELKAKQKWLKRRRKATMRYLEDAQVAVRAKGGGTEVAVLGNAAVKAQHTSGRLLLLYPGLVFVGKDETLPAPQPSLDQGPLFYNLEGNPGEWSFRNALNDQQVLLDPAFPEPVPKTVSLNPGPTELDPNTGEPVVKTETLKLGPGPVTFTEDVILPETAHLIVQPGTQLKLAPGKSLFSRGRVTMEGTAKEPIQIVAEDPRQPFGTIGLVGKGTAGSRFRHVDVQGGSTAHFGSVNFKGMFNVYSCPEVTLESCSFSNNRIGDDLVNLGLSKVEVRDCKFFKSTMDALDLDGCEGSLEDSTFYDCGNDGLDIMQTRLQVNNCQFDRCGDKAISIGENCATTIEDAQIRHCLTGLEFKDGSRTKVLTSTISGCTTAVRAYRKKWLFRIGGEAQLVDTTVQECGKDIELDPYSQVWLSKTSLRVPAALADRVHREGTFELGAGPRVKPITP